MAYTPTVWATGDVITAAKLNKAENGIAAASDEVLVITITWGADYNSATLDKTLADITGAQVPIVIASYDGHQFYYAGPHFTDPSEDPDGVYLYNITFPGGTGVIASFLFQDVDGTLTWTNAQ